MIISTTVDTSPIVASDGRTLPQEKHRIGMIMATVPRVDGMSGVPKDEG